MRITRREFLKYCTVAAGALGLTTTDLLKIEEALGKAGTDSFGAAPYVVWLPGQACTGCTVSFANTIYFTDVASLALEDISINYQEQLMAAVGDKAVQSAVTAIGRPMVLALEGAIPYGGTGDSNEEFCTIWTRTGGILAAGSVVNSIGGALNEGMLVGSSSMSLSAGSIIAGGSELVAGTSLPAGTIVDSAGDIAAMKALGASFNASVSSSYGTDFLNTNWTLTSAVTMTGAGTLDITGGTDASNTSMTAVQGSLLAGGSAGTTLASGTIVTSSFDRLWLSNQLNNTNDTAAPIINAVPAATFNFLGTGNNWSLNAAVQLTKSRAVSGPMSIASTSTIAANSQLKAGSKVTNATLKTAIITQSGNANIFGYGTTGEANILASPGLSLGGTKEIFLNGNVTLPALFGGSIGGNASADKSIYHEARLFATSAAAVLAIGTCASFGGIPAAQGNLTGASGALYKGLTKPGKFNGAMTEFAGKTINISGCPPHPDWIVGTIAYLLKTNYSLPPVEAYGRPFDYYGQYQCNAGPCEWRYNQGYKASDETSYVNPKVTGTATVPGAPGYATINSSLLYKNKWANDASGKKYVGCIGVLGCKGRKTKADCSLRRWNADANLQYGAGWCVSGGSGCKGCTEPSFPDKVGKFFNFA